MKDDFRPSAGSRSAAGQQKPLDIFNTDESLKSAAVRRPAVDFDRLEDMMGEPDSYDAPPTPEDAEGPGQSPHTPNKLTAWWHRRTKKQQIILVVLSLVLIGAISGTSAYFVAHNNKPKAVAAPKKIAKTVEKPVVTTVASALSGLQVDPAANARPVVAVMIENSLDARPQSGLDQAGVVFEAIAEGGITRFMALFQDTQPNLIGPIRSVRPYYQTWAMGFDAPMAHVGGSPEALANVKAWGIKDLDQFYNSSAYHRTSNRAAPHNVYSSAGQLTTLAQQKGYTASTFTSFPRKKEQAIVAGDTRTPAKVITMNISSPSYNTRYEYDAATNSYNRFMAGSPHLALNAAGTKNQIKPKVVIALVMPYSIASDHKHSIYGTVGSGQAYVYQDGTVTVGTWSKSSNTAQVTLTGSDGQPLKLNPGQTWITAVKAANNVSSQ